MSFRKKIYAAGGATSIFMGPGRPEFDPKKGMRPFKEVLLESASETLNILENPLFDEGVIGSFMSGRFLNQANLPGYLPFLVPSLLGKSCLAVEGACGTGGKAIASGVKSLLSDIASSVFVLAFEMQNRMKPIYGADVLAGAADYETMRKEGHAHFFPGLFDQRAKAYMDAYGKEMTKEAFAKWYERAILNARKHPKAQEHFNKTKDLFITASISSDPENFLPHLTPFDCSKVTDGAASIALFTYPKDNCVEILAIGESEGNITKPAANLLELTNTKNAVQKALKQANLTIDKIDLFEIHDCFSISGLLSIEAIGLAKPGQAKDYVLQKGDLPINSTGGLIGFGHPTGASGVRQLVDLQQQLKSGQYGMLVSMGGDDITVTSIIVKKVD